MGGGRVVGALIGPMKRQKVGGERGANKFQNYDMEYKKMI